MDKPENWTPQSWQHKVAMQQVAYPEEVSVDEAVKQLKVLPPLVTSWELLSLREQLKEVAQGKRFLLWGGDCAESFDDCRPDVITSRLKVLLQMSLLMVHGLKLPVARVGRFAGQYAKPRSADFETRGGVTLPSYRGDLINGSEFTEEARSPDPARLLQGHARSAMTMNFVRSLVQSGFADLHHPEYWDLDWIEHSPLAKEYRAVVRSIADSVSFMETLAGCRISSLDRADFYTSHEALHLPYEQDHTRQVPRQWGWFNLSTHFPWIGLRTADPDGAHVEYCRGIRNPIAVKVGPPTKAADIERLMDILNPEDEAGRLTLIHRMGSSKIERYLPPLVKAVMESGRQVVWCCDPMHGNTEITSSGAKTRRFDNIRTELELAFDIHADLGSRLGGVHLELTGENVAECLGGARNLAESDLARAYKSQVDPRLNYEQALELAMLVVRKHSNMEHRSGQ